LEKGLSQSEIARSLGITRQRVHQHVAKIRAT
jgi:DNA-binding CsgD family transcriptional regulator